METNVTEAPTHEIDLSEFTTLDQGDAELELKCEHEHHDTGKWGHDGPGRVLLLVLHECPKRQTKLYLMCQTGWDYLVRVGNVTCGDCGWKGPTSEALKEMAILD